MAFVEKPPIPTGQTRADISALRDYLFRMVQSLNEVGTARAEVTGALVGHDSSGRQVFSPAGGSGGTDTEAIRKNAEELKSLIIKHARDLQTQLDNIEYTSFYIKFADEFSGSHPSKMYSVPTENTCYMGVCRSASTVAPMTPALYTWLRVRGEGGTLMNTATVVLYRRASRAPVGPESRYLFNFATGTLQELGTESGAAAHRLDDVDGTVRGHLLSMNSGNVTGHRLRLTGAKWSQQIPEPNGQPCWIVQAAAAGTGETAAIEPEAWSESALYEEDGTTGKTTYLHVKFSDDGLSFTGNAGEELGAYIGMYTDFIQADSTLFSDYEWQRMDEDTVLAHRLDDQGHALKSWVLNVYSQTKREEYDSLYIAQSEFGTFTESISRTVEESARGVVDSYHFGEMIQGVSDKTDLLQEYYTSLNGEIRRGIVEDPEHLGTYVLGIAISQNLQFSGICGEGDPNNPGDGFDYYYLNSGQTFGLYTSTGWQFWIDGYKRGWYNSEDGMLHVAKILVEQTLQIGEFWQVLSDGSGLEFKYIGS